MRPGPDGALLAASLAFAGAAGLGSAVAVRDQLPGRPFGISVPLSVPAGLLAGWGAGVAPAVPIASSIAGKCSPMTWFSSRRSPRCSRCPPTARMLFPLYPNTTDFRRFRLAGVLRCLCSVRARKSVSGWCEGILQTRVSRRGWRAVPRSAVPRARAVSSFLTVLARASRSRARIR